MDRDGAQELPSLHRVGPRGPGGYCSGVVVVYILDVFLRFVTFSVHLVTYEKSLILV